ncbi:gag-pol polyprotein [Trichonephila clavipes]|nr:gag-pol polyprotein [Trichonephila clavipes]
MDVCKCIVPLRHGGTLNRRRAASPLVGLVEGEERWRPLTTPGVLPQNWGGNEPNRTTICMVLKAKANDMRANISVIPKSFAPPAKVQQDLTLYAANDTKIPTYGTKRILLDLRLRCQFTWSFVIANERQPIIVVDFVKHFNLLVEAKHHRVIDANTKLFSNGQFPKIKSVASNLAILVGSTNIDKVLKNNIPN